MLRHHEIFGQLAEIADQCLDDAADESSIARALMLLISKIPSIDQLGVTAQAPIGKFEMKLSADCPLEATLMLIGSNVGYMISRGPTQDVIATIAIPNPHLESTFSGSTEAKAMMGALATALWQMLELQSK